MLTLLKDLFANRTSTGSRDDRLRDGPSDTTPVRRFLLRRSNRRLPLRQERTSSAEQLEPRLALTVGAFSNNDTVFVHVDGTNAESHAYLRGTETGDLLVSGDDGFFNAAVVEDVYKGGPLDNMVVFSGTSRLDEVLSPLEWWILPAGNELSTTGLHLSGDGQMYAFGLIEPDSELDRWPTAGYSAGKIFTSGNPGSPQAEVFGTISYTQSDGTVSRWYFSNYNPDTARFDSSLVKITAGPGVPPQSDASTNSANRNNPDLFVPVTDLVEGYNFPTSIEIVRGASDWDRQLEVQWNAKPTNAPVITATYPVVNVNTTDRNLGTDQSPRRQLEVSYTVLRQITRSGTLSRPDLDYRLAGAYSTGFGGDAASVGRFPGFFGTRLDFPTTHRSWDNDDAVALANDQDGVVKTGGPVAVATAATLGGNTNGNQFGESFVNDTALIQPLGSITVSASFDAGKRDAGWLLSTSGTFVTSGAETQSRDYQFNGVNVFRGASPEMLDTEYLTWAKDGPGAVTFSPGPDFDYFNDITIELTSPESVVNINTELVTTNLDVRATNIVVNAETTVAGELYVGRSTQLLNIDGSDRPRLTLSQDFGDTPVMQPANWVVEGIEPVFAPVFGPGGSIARLEIPAGGEGYGYDPDASPLISVTPPTPQQAIVDVIGVSGTLSGVTVESSGEGLTDGRYKLTAAEEQSYAMVRKISIGGVYDYFGGGPVVADAVPLVVVDPPTLATDKDRIGYGEAARVVAAWTSGVTAVQTQAVTYTITGAKTEPAGSISASFDVESGDTGLIRQAATVNPITVPGVITENKVGNDTTYDATYRFPGGTRASATYGAGYAPATRSYGGTVRLGPVTGALSATEFRDGLLSVSVLDGGLNYDPEESVGVYVLTQLDGAGVALVSGYTPALEAELAEGSTFFGDEITLAAVTTAQTRDLDLLEYLNVGMPLRGPGFSASATVAGVDYASRVVSVSPGGIIAPALLGSANFYPHEYYVENQPAAEAIQGLTTAVTLERDYATLEAEVIDGQLLSVSILEPVDDPYDGEFPGRRGGSGYQVVPDMFPIFSTIPGPVSPSVSGRITGEIAEAAVRVQGSNYLATLPDRDGTLDVEVFGGTEVGLLRLDVASGRLSGSGEIINRGSGFQSRAMAVENVPEPDDFLPGQGAPALFRAVVEPDGTIRETIRIDGGSEYVVTPNVYIEAPLTISDARAVAVVDPKEAAITAINLQAAGSGYTQPPAVTIAPPGPDGVGRRALAVATIESGKITRIQIVDPGSGYTGQPEVYISSPYDPAVVETVQMNASITVDTGAELYVGDERSTTEPRRGVLSLASQTSLGGNLNSMYIEARASDIISKGAIQTDQGGSLQVQLISPALEQYGGAFTFAVQDGGRIATGDLLVGLENQSELSGGSYQHDIRLDTAIASLRVSTATDPSTGAVAPYSLAISESDDLNVDAVLAAGGDISLKAAGTLNVNSSLITDAGVFINAQDFTVRSPVVSQAGPVRIETDKTLNVLNGLRVLSPQEDPLADDIKLVGKQGILIQGEVSALNNIRLEATNGGVNTGVPVEETSLISTAGELVVSVAGNVSVQTAVASADIRTGGTGVVTLVESDDIYVDIQAQRVEIVAMGVDPGVYGANFNALEGVLHDVEFASLSAPQGSIYISSDIATRFELDRSANAVINDQEYGLQAAGNVVINALAAEVIVRDAPLAGGNARPVRYATSLPLPIDVSYDQGQSGVTAGVLEGEGEVTGAGQPFEGLSLNLGDLVLIKNEIGEKAIRNGIYAVDRLGGGDAGFVNWRLVRSSNATSEDELPSGTFVNVREGDEQGVYQIQYVPTRKQVVQVSRQSQLSVGTESLFGLDLGQLVSGDGVVSTAEVAGIDWQNRLVTLGLPAGVMVQAISASDLRSRFGDEELKGIVQGYDPSKGYVGLELAPYPGALQSGADHPLVQSVISAVGNGQVVRFSAESQATALAPLAYAVGGSGNTIVLTPESIGESWQAVVANTSAFRVYAGFVGQGSDGRVLNPSVRSQLMGLPIESIDGDTITVGESFFRWDVVVPGQRVSGDGLAESARVLSVSPASRRVVLSADAMPSAFPQSATLLSSVSPGGNGFGDYDQIFLDAESVTEQQLEAIQPGMLVASPGVKANTVVVAVDLQRAVIAVAAGSVDSWGSPQADIANRLNVIEPETGRTLFGTEGAAVSNVVRANGEVRFADSIVLGVDSAFTDLDFGKLRLGMEVSGAGIRPGAQLLSMDARTRSIGITPGSIEGAVTSITFKSPVYDISTELQSGRLSLVSDGDKTLDLLVAEGKISPTITAPVDGARTSAQSIGTFAGELYRLIQTEGDRDILPTLVPEARTRFLDDSSSQSWQENVVLGQEVVTDLVQFDAVSLGLTQGERILDAVITDRTALAGVPAYLREGTGTRVTAVVETSTGSLSVRRWEHVGATDEFVTQAVGSEVELEGWDAAGGLVVAMAVDGSTLAVTYQVDADSGSWREVEVSGLATSFSLVVQEIKMVTARDYAVYSPAAGGFGGFFYPSLQNAGEDTKVTTAAHVADDRFLVGYSDGRDYVVADWHGVTNQFGEEWLRASGAAVAIAVSPSLDQAVVVASGLQGNAATFIDLAAAANEVVALNLGEPSEVRYSADGASVAVGMGSNGVAILVDVENSPRLSVTYDLAESIDLIVDSPRADAWGGLAMLDEAGEIVVIQNVELFDRSLDRSRVLGVDYRLGVVSLTDDAVGLGEDLRVMQAGAFRYAVAPAATLSFLTEAQVEPQAVRYDDGGGELDTGALREVVEGSFEDGYVIVDDLVGAVAGDAISDALSLWQTLANQVSADEGKYVYAKNAQGQWVYFAEMTGVDSYNRLVGLRSTGSGSSSLERLRNITVGTIAVELMVTPTHVEGVDYRVLSDGSAVRLNRYWPDQLAEQQVEQWQGNEILLTVQAERPSDGAGNTEMFVGSVGSQSRPVRLASGFVSGMAIRPGMHVSGDGIESNTTVEAIDRENNLVWLSRGRSLAEVGDAPAGRFIQFSYSVARPDGLLVSERLGVITAGGQQVERGGQYAEGRLVSDLSEIVTLSSASGTNQLQQLNIGADVLPHYEAAVSGGGVVTGVDWKIGLIGVSEGVVVDAQRLEMPNAHLLQFQDGNGGQSRVFSVDVERATSELSGRRGGLVVGVLGTDGGVGAGWASLEVGGEVYAEIVADELSGDARELIPLGILQGFDAQLGQLYLRDQTAESQQLFDYQKQAAPRLVVLSPSLSQEVAGGLVDLAYRPEDPLYTDIEASGGGGLQVMQIRALASSFSQQSEVTRLAVSDSDTRELQSNWVALGVAKNARWVVAGVPQADTGLTLAEIAGIVGKDLQGGGVVSGSVATAVGLTAGGMLVDTNFGLSDGTISDVIAISSTVALRNESSGLVVGSYTANGSNGDLLSIGGYEFIDHLIRAMESQQVVTVTAVGSQSSETGAWIRANTRVIGIDADNSVLVVEPGAILTNDVSDIRFFINGRRAELDPEVYLAEGSRLSAGEYLPDAGVGLQLSGIDASGAFTGADIVAVVLQRDGIESGTFAQQRFSSFDQIDIEGNTKVFSVPLAGVPAYLGDVVGLDAENMLVGIRAADAATAEAMSLSLVQGTEIRFQVNGVWLESVVGGQAIKPAIVQSSSAFTQRVAGSLFDSSATELITRFTVTDELIDITTIQLGDVVTDGEGYVSEPVQTPSGEFKAVRVVGVDPVNRIIAVAWTDPDGTIIERSPALVESLGLTSVFVESVTPQDVAAPVILDVSVEGARRQVAGSLTGDLVRLDTTDLVMTGHLLGTQVAAMPGSVFGAGGEILGTTGAFGLVSVTGGTVVARSSGPVEIFETKADVEAWSEGELRSTNLPGVFNGSQFSQSRAVIEGGFRSGQIERLNLGGRLFIGGNLAGSVTGFDPAIGLLGVAEADGVALATGDILDVELTQLSQRGDYRIERETAVGTFSGTRLLAQAAGFFDLSGNPIAAEVVQLGMPVWSIDDSLIGYVTGIARVVSADYGDAVMFGLTAHGEDLSGNLISGNLSLLEGSSRGVQFGGQYSAPEGRVMDAVAELIMLEGRMEVAAWGDLSTNTPSDVLSHGLSGPRVTVSGQFPPTADLLGAAVTGPGVPADTIVTGYDADLAILGLSNPISVGTGLVDIDITPVESIDFFEVTVTDSATDFVGDLNGDARFILAESVVLPFNAEPWLGKQITFNNVPGSAAIIRGVDLEHRLVAVDWTDTPFGNVAPGTALSVEIVRGAVLGHSGSSVVGSSFDLINSTTLFVDPSSLSYLQTSVSSSSFVTHDVAVGDLITVTNGAGEFNRFAIRGIDNVLGLIVVEDQANLPNRQSAEWLLTDEDSVARVVAVAPLTSSSGPLLAGSNGEQHEFEYARFVLNENTAWDEFFVGQEVVGAGLTTGRVITVTGIDVDNRLVGLKVAGGSVNSVADNSDDSVVDFTTSGRLTTLAAGRDVLLPTSSSRGATPALDGSRSEATAILNVGTAFPYAWLHGAMQQVDAYRATPSNQSLRQEVTIEGLGASGQVVFRLDHDVNDSAVVSYDPRLGLLQLVYETAYDLSAVESLKISLYRPVDLSGTHFAASDLAIEVALDSFSISESDAATEAAFAHRIYVTVPSISDLAAQLGAYATVAGPGIQGSQRITSFGQDEIGSYLTIAAGGVLGENSPVFGSSLYLSPDDSSNPAETLAVSVSRVVHSMVGEISRDAVRLADASAETVRGLVLGGKLEGTGISNYGTIAGYDTANEIVYLETGGSASADVLSSADSIMSFELESFRSAPIGSVVGDSLRLSDGVSLDLSDIRVGDRVKGDGILSNTRVLGINPAAGTITLTAGGVTSVQLAGAITVVRTDTEYSINTNKTSRARGVDRSGVLIKIDEGFEQYDRIYVGQEVGGDGLTEFATITAIDSDNRLVVLAAESVEVLGRLDVLRFTDSDGEFSAIVDVLKDGTPKASFARGLPGSTVVGQLTGDLIAIPESAYEFFSTYGTRLIGTKVEGAVLDGSHPVIGYDAVTGLISLPVGAVQKSYSELSAANRQINVSEGLTPFVWEFGNNDLSMAKLSFETDAASTDALSRVRPGQTVQGIGVNESAIVEQVDYVNGLLWIRSRNSGDVITLDTSVKPRNISFGVPSSLELGATTIDGSGSVVFEASEFGSTPIRVVSRAIATVREVGPSGTNGTQLATRALTVTAQREAWQQFAEAQRDQVVEGPGIADGTYVYRPVHASGEVVIQTYSGVVYQAPAGMPRSNSDYEVSMSVPASDGSQWYAENRLVNALVVGESVQVLGSRGSAGARDWVRDQAYLGTVAAIDHSEKQVVVAGVLPDAFDGELWSEFDVVVGSPFDATLLRSANAFTAASIRADVGPGGQPGSEMEPRSVIKTENAQGATRFIVGASGSTPVTNQTSRSLGKMIGVWRATAKADAVDLTDPNPAFTFQFDAGVETIILGQQLPTLDVPILIDGQNRFGGSADSRVVIDGSVIAIDEFGQAAKGYGEGGVYGFVFDDFGASAIKKQAGVEGLNFVGFTEGAAVMLSNAQNILVANNQFGFDAENVRRANRFGVVVEGDSSHNTIMGNVFAGSEDTAVLVTGAASSNFIVGNTLGVEAIGSNRIGIHLEATGNRLGVPVSSFSQVYSGDIILDKTVKNSEGEVVALGQRVVHFKSADADLSNVTVGMSVVLESYSTVMHEVVGVDPSGRRLTIQELQGNQNSEPATASRVNDSLQELVASVGYSVTGGYNSNTVTMSAKTFRMVQDAMFVGQAVSGPDIPAGTTVIGIQENSDDTYEVTLSQRLLGFGYDIYQAPSTRLLAFGNNERNVITQSHASVQLGVGWEYGQLAVYDGVLAMKDDPNVAGRTFTGWDIVEYQMQAADKLYAIVSKKDLDGTAGGVYRIPVSELDRTNGSFYFPDLLETEVLEKFDDGTKSWQSVSATNALSELAFVEDVVVTFMAADANGHDLTLGGGGGVASHVVGNQLLGGYQDAVKILDGGAHAVGDARASSVESVFSEASVDRVELTSWGLEVAVPPGGGAELPVSESQLEILRRMLQDWNGVERDAASDPDPERDGELDFSGLSINVYGYGVNDNVRIQSVIRSGGAWRLQLTDNPFIDDMTGSTTLSFGVGWYVSSDVASKGLWVSDEVVSEREELGERVPGRHLPEFTQVREIGTSFIRVSTPLYGQRVQYSADEYRGVEGFRPKADGSAPLPMPISFISSRFGNVIADNEGAGVEITRSAAMAAIARMNPSDTLVEGVLSTPKRSAVSGNTFGLLTVGDGLVEAENRGGAISNEFFGVIYGVQVPAGTSVPIREYVNDWGKQDQFGNTFAEEDLAFIIELPQVGAGAGDRPTFWYL